MQHFTLLVGGKYHGSMVHHAGYDYVYVDKVSRGFDVDSWSDAVVAKQESPIDVSGHEAYELDNYDITWPSGIVWRYWFYVHVSLLESIDENTYMIPLFSCHVDRFYADKSLGRDGSQFRYGNLNMGLN